MPPAERFDLVVLSERTGGRGRGFKAAVNGFLVHVALTATHAFVHTQAPPAMWAAAAPIGLECCTTRVLYH